MSFESIQKPVQQELAAMTVLLSQAFVSKVPLIEEIGQHILHSGGKRLRPLLLLLCTKACGYLGSDHIAVAALIELIHTATLLHDDVVDEATQRRGQKTASHQWGNEAAILVGDFLYSKAFQLLLDIDDRAIMQILVNTTNQMAEGEALQLLNRRKLHLSEQDYLTIIEAKTARLFEASAHSAAVLSQSSSKITEAMKQYGLHLGMAFQLIDDVLDYQINPTQIGKDVGKDLAEGKMTLPLIYTCMQGTRLEIQRIQDTIEHYTSQSFTEVLESIHRRGGLDYTRQQAQNHISLAQQALDQLPTSPYQEAAFKLADFVIARQY